MTVFRYMLPEVKPATVKRHIYVKHSIVRKIPPWIVVSFAALLLRLPLMCLPGAGRDEATYFYWSWHPEPAYAPLIQLLLALFNRFPWSELVTLRLPSILGGILVLWLFERLLRQRKVPRKEQVVALLLLAFTPWQTYVGSFLHPDNLLLVTALALVLWMEGGCFRLAAVVSALAFWAKPAGILVTAAAWLSFIYDQRISRKKSIWLILFSLLLIIPVVLSFNWKMIRAIAEFGKMDPSFSAGQAILLQLISVTALGGIGLPLAAIFGLWHRRERLNIRDWHAIDDRVTLAIWFNFCLAFGAAMLLTGQIKGNWILPALVLLWPKKRLCWPRWATVAALLSALLLSSAMVLGFSQPHWLAALEKQFPRWKTSYQLQAGSREARVSTTGSWTERVREYQAKDKFLTAVKRHWYKEAGKESKPGWIICDDYGIAAQTIFEWGDPGIKMLITGDGIFAHRLPQKHAPDLHGSVLVIAVHRPLGKIWPGLKNLQPLAAVPHPTTDETILIGVSNIPAK